MSKHLDIQRVYDADNIPSDEQLTQWFLHWSNVSHQKESVEATLRIVDLDEIQALNAQYRGKDKPTNVLSFSSEIPEFVDSTLIGDIIISPQVIDIESKEQNKTAEAHWAHLLIHGLLHLQGYDHLHDDEAQIMEKLEVELLKGLGYTNPYAEQD